MACGQCQVHGRICRGRQVGGWWLLYLLIMPLWCRCCRHHDLGCPISIEPGQTRYGLTNVRIHTVMHCSCDERFRSCLKMARTQAADIVGNLFFNVADIPCFVFSKAKVTFKQNLQFLLSFSSIRFALPATGGAAVLHSRRNMRRSGGNLCRTLIKKRRLQMLGGERQNLKYKL